MKKLLAFSDEDGIFEIIGWKYPDKELFRKYRWWREGDKEDGSPQEWKDYCKHHEELWDKGFNLDDWDFGVACKEPLHKEVKNEDYDPERDPWDRDRYKEWDNDVYWLGSQMDNYCVGSHYCFAYGYHWYTVHHS